MQTGVDRIVENLGGSPEKNKTGVDKILEILESGGGGGGGLPEVTSADEGKVLAVNASGEWAAENRNGICIETEGVLNKSYNDLVSMVHSGILPFVYIDEGEVIITMTLNMLVPEGYEASFITGNGVIAVYSAESATSPLIYQD